MSGQELGAALTFAFIGGMWACLIVVLLAQRTTRTALMETAGCHSRCVCEDVSAD